MANEPRQPDEPTPPGVFVGDAGGVSSPAPTARRLGPAASLQLLLAALLVPVTAVALVPFWLVTFGIVGVPYWLFLVAYLAAFAAMLVRPIQRRLLLTFFRAREPTPDERDLVEPTWHAVLDQAGIPHDRYVLAVSDSHQPNAFAAGGHVVAVTTGALHHLPADELEGVLAHELGHHLGLHTLTPLALYWLELPVLWLGRVAHRVERIALWISDVAVSSARDEAVVYRNPVAARRGLAVGTVFTLASVVARLAAWLLLLPVRVVGGLTALVGRRVEHDADRAAVDLGFGGELARALQRFAQLDRSEPAVAWARGRFLSPQPPLAARIRRIQARLARAADDDPAGGAGRAG